MTGIRSILFAALLLASTLAQTTAPKPPATAPATQSRGTTLDLAQLQKSYADQMKTSLALTEDQWLTIEPIIAQINSLRGHLHASGGSSQATMLLLIAPKVEHADAVNEMIKGLTQASQQLNKLLAETDPAPDALKFALKDLRQAKAAVQDELNKQQAALKRLLTPRQEALLKQNGTLD